MSEFMVFGAPQIEQPEIDEVVQTLQSGWIGTGPRVSRLEQQFAAYKGRTQALAVNSCTAALHLSLIACGVGPGDEVITTALTFCATVNAIIHTGARPVLVDVDDSMNLDLSDVERKLTSRTKAILPVHFAGRPCDLAGISAIAASHGLKVVEDCAHAIESEIGGMKCGTVGDFGCFSFYVTKNVVTGEGGMIIARDESALHWLRKLSLHGMDADAWKRFGADGYKHYDVIGAGYKYNMMDLQAALGIHQLARVERNWQKRRCLWKLYHDRLQGLPLRLPTDPGDGVRHAYHLYTVQVEGHDGAVQRDALILALKQRGIGVGVHYRALPEFSFYQQRFGWNCADYPKAVSIGRRTISLPLSARLDDNDVRRVASAVRDAFESISVQGG